MDQQDIDLVMDLIAECKDKLVIVEGINDKRSLEKLGFTDIFYINRKPIYQVVELLANRKEVMILTDLDAEGRKLYSTLKEHLGMRKVKIDDRLREALFKTDLRQIEGLYRSACA